MRFELSFEPDQTQERFVDRIDFEVGCEVGEHAHHPRAHVAIERVIAGSHHDAGFPETLAAQMPGRAHLDAEGLGFVRARDDASVGCKTWRADAPGVKAGKMA
jgi:hypothetical protein